MMPINPIMKIIAGTFEESIPSIIEENLYSDALRFATTNNKKITDDIKTINFVKKCDFIFFFPLAFLVCKNRANF